MIFLKTPKEIAKMREGGIILGKLLDEVLPSVISVGKNGSDIESVCYNYIVASKAIPILKGYDTGSQRYDYTICFSVNEEAVHGLPLREKILREDSIVTVDVCLKWEGFFLDAARTYSVGGDSLDLLKVTKEALDEAINEFSIGNTIGHVSSRIQTRVEDASFSVVREFCGHGIGKSLHEDPKVLNYGEPGRGPSIQDGMVLAIEPIVSAGSGDVNVIEDGWTVVTCDGSKAAHFEDTVAMVDGKAKILTRVEEG